MTDKGRGVWAGLGRLQQDLQRDKAAARTLQTHTGWSYQQALHAVRLRLSAAGLCAYVTLVNCEEALDADEEPPSMPTR